MAIQKKHKNVPIPEDLHKKLKSLAVDDGGTIKDILIVAVEEYIKKRMKVR